MDNTVRPSHMRRLAGPQIIKKIERQSASAVDHIQKPALFEVPKYLVESSRRLGRKDWLNNTIILLG
ncbi:MAG: hypothetical protein ACXW13_11020 [Burkholderiaceae bacterium]